MIKRFDIHMQKFFFILLSLVLWKVNIFGQTSRSHPTDFETWASIGLKIDLPKKWALDMDYQIRTDSTARRYKGSYLSSEVSYKMKKKLDGFLNYRFASTINGKTSRLGFGIEYTEKKNNWSMAFRPQLQYTFRYADDGESSSQKWLLRTRLLASHKLVQNWELYASSEPYFTFDKTEYFIDNLRNTLGVKHKFDRGKKIDIFYIYRPDYSKSYNRTFHVIGIKLDFSVK